MTPRDDERSTIHQQAILPDAIPPNLSTTSSASTPLLCAVCCMLSTTTCRTWLQYATYTREPTATLSQRQVNASCSSCSCSFRMQIYRSPESRKPQIHRRLRSNIVDVRMLTHYAKLIVT
jgi:hypothetical protein